MPFFLSILKSASKLVCIALVVIGFFSFADEPKPFLEGGLSGGVGFTPDYPAAGQSRLHWLVFPVFHVRGKIFRSDDKEGTRARVFKDVGYTFDISAAGSFPAYSSQNEARRGMPNLDWIGELGPRIHARVLGNEEHFVRVALALRGAFSTDFTRLDYRGLVLAPSIWAQHENLLFNCITVSARATANFATRELHSYFYDVEERYSSLDRPAYHARGGYIGTNLYSVLSYEKPAYGIYTGMGLALHDGAANMASPLFKERVNTLAFVGFRWFFYKSKEPGHL